MSRRQKPAPKVQTNPPEWIYEVAGILCFALAIFSIVALATYHPNDPSAFVDGSATAQNACGKIGAYLAAACLQVFGLGAFLLPAALLFIAATFHYKEGWTRILSILGGMSVAVMSLTVFLALQWQYVPYANTLLLTGGILGSWVQEALIAQFNPTGASIISLAVFALAISLSTPLQLMRWIWAALTWTGQLLWKLIKLTSTSAVYLLGMAGMRAAQATGHIVQRAIENFAQRTRELNAARLEAKAQRALLKAEAAKEVEVIPGPNTEATEIQIAMADEEEAEEPEDEEELEYEAGEYEEDEEYEDEEYDEDDEYEDDEAEEEEPQTVVLQPEPTQLPLGVTQPQIVSSKVDRKLERFKARHKGNWKIPSIEFLTKPSKGEAKVDRSQLIENSQILKQKFADFGIEGEVTAVRPGPVITLYEFKPGPGIKVSRIAALADDLSMALSAESVRILAPLPGKAVVGIEIPSPVREKVLLREFLQHKDFAESRHLLPLAMGKDIAGQVYLSDLARMPHLLCAGQTGSGKSVFMNSLICSLLYRFTPDDMRMILVDPKFIEFRAYQDIPHLLLPIVDDAKNASTALKWAVREMERRYRILAKMGVRNLESFNNKVEEMGAEVVKDLLYDESEDSARMAPSSGADWYEAFEPGENGEPAVGKLPYVVVIIDELADLMMIAKKEVEVSIARIAQKARAAGIHLIIATQRPSTDVITGLIKANLPSRVSFSLASFIDSKTILDKGGAERLLGRGDMLFIPPGVSQNVRLHGAWVDDDEIHKITSFLRAQGKPFYRDEILLDEEEDADETEEEMDALFTDGVELVKRSGHASASFLQRHLKIGYNRAARMIETMESRGIVGPAEGSRPREVLVR